MERDNDGIVTPYNPEGGGSRRTRQYPPIRFSDFYLIFSMHGVASVNPATPQAKQVPALFSSPRNPNSALGDGILCWRNLHC
jgi:hypothetical protein